MQRGIPGMYDKAYRWVGEMEEISDFLDANAPSSDMYAAIARLYEYLAAAEAGSAPGRRQRDQDARPGAGTVGVCLKRVRPTPKRLMPQRKGPRIKSAAI